MNKIFKYIFIELGLIIFFYIIFPALIITEKVDLKVEGGKPVLPLQIGRSYLQVISNPTKSINSISLQLKNPEIKDNSLIYIEILDELGTLQKDFSIYGANIGDPSWIKLDFSPIDKPNLILRVSGESQFDNTLYLFADDDASFDLKTTYALSNFKSRIWQNLNSQAHLFMSRSLWHNILYLFTLIILNFFLVKLLYENSKK